MREQKELDLVVFGATGYTGKLVAEYLRDYTQTAQEDVTWGIAGRSSQKLKDVRDDLRLAANVSLIEVDAKDEAALNKLCEMTSSICTTVGPYELYGETLIRACASNGTHYADLCGEPLFMKTMIAQYSQMAEESGARITFSCGFDSIPFDLGVFFLQDHAQSSMGHALPEVKARVRKMKGKFSGGTAASMNETTNRIKRNPDELNALLNPYALTPGQSGVGQPPANNVVLDEDLGLWVSPFVMEIINSKNIHRSNHLLENYYGRDFTYNEMMVTGEGEAGREMAEIVKKTNIFADGEVPKPGEGPSKEERETGFYDILILGKDKDGRQLRAAVTGDKDPGYGSTSKMLAQAGLSLAKDDLPSVGGVHTPTSAFRGKLFDRLSDHAGVKFAIEDKVD